jgi:hypothetical protein
MLDRLFNIVLRPDYTSLSAYQSDAGNLNIESARVVTWQIKHGSRDWVKSMPSRQMPLCTVKLQPGHRLGHG